MKIVFIAPRFHTNMYFYAKALKMAGHEVLFLAMYKSNSENYDDVEPIILPSSLINRVLRFVGRKYQEKMHYWPSFWGLRHELAKINPDVLLVKNLQGGLSFFSMFWGIFYAKKTFVLVQTEKHFIKSPAKKIIAWFFKNIFKVRGIITPLANSLSKTDSWFKYIPFVIDVKDFNKEYFKNGNINILEVGKFYERKEHLLMLKVVNSLKEKYPIKLTIIGERADESVLKKVYSYIENNDLSSVVEVKENLPHKMVLEMYKDYDLFVLPSRDEPAAYSIVEAMANGLPVIASDTCGTSCYIKDGENGYVFKSSDKEDLKDKIEKIIKDRGELIEMGKRSYKKAFNDHGLKVFLEKFKYV